MKDSIEFYHENKMIASSKSSFRINVGDLISIRKKTWKVSRVTFALDNADFYNETAMRCNVDLTPVKEV